MIYRYLAHVGFTSSAEVDSVCHDRPDIDARVTAGFVLFCFLPSSVLVV